MTDLYPRWLWGELDLTAAPFAWSFGSDLGAPQTATEALAQLLTDGEVEVSPRASNRTLQFTVYVESSDLLESAESEALLAAEADRERNTLSFDPGDGFAPTTVYDTFRAQLSFVRDDKAEWEGFRRYDVTLKASPFGRSVSPVETPAINSAIEPVVVTISAADEPTGWTARRVITDGGSFLTATDAPTLIATAIYTPASPVDLTATRYVSLVMYGGLGMPQMFVNDVALPLVGSVPTSTPGQTRFYWQTEAGTSATKFTARFSEGGTSFSFYSLQRTDSLPFAGTARQKQRTLDVNGSARTQGSLAIEHETTALGSTLVYTWPASDTLTYSPAMRARRVSGDSIADTSLVSGARDLLDTALVYDVPVSALIAGTHLLLARLRSDTNGDQSVMYTAQVRQGSVNVGTATTGTTVVPFATTPTIWRNVVLARLMLPPTDVPVGSSAVVRVTIVATSTGASNIDLDEAWLFNTSVGDLSWVECGSGADPAAGGVSNRLWLDTATTERPRPAIYRGFADDRSDAFYPGSDVRAFGTHEFAPPLMNVFTVTSAALDAAVSLSHFPRWHTHAAS